MPHSVPTQVKIDLLNSEVERLLQLRDQLNSQKSRLEIDEDLNDRLFPGAFKAFSASAKQYRASIGDPPEAATMDLRTTAQSWVNVNSKVSIIKGELEATEVMIRTYESLVTRLRTDIQQMERME